MEGKSITELMSRCCEEFRQQGRTSNPIRYQRIWENGILPYMSAKGILLYTPEIGKTYLESVDLESMSYYASSCTVRSIRMLDDMLLYGKIRKHCSSVPETELLGSVGNSITDFLRYSGEIRRSTATIASYKSYLFRFYGFVSEYGIEKPEDIKIDHILEFVGTYPTISKDGVLKTIRVMYRYWQTEGVVDNDLPCLLKRTRCVKPIRLPSFFTPEEVGRIEKSVERSSAVGKCDYAMILLASRLGLRVSDISGLEFSNIDWDTNTITITTRKTMKRAEFPLLPEIGDALIDYIRGGRPNSTSNRVFLSARPPYGPLRAATASQRIRNCISASGVNAEGRSHGPHSLRHSLANALLGNGVKMPTISEVLAHRNTQSTMSYLRIDVGEQKKCALDVSPINDTFYTQKNGFFYGNSKT